VHFGQHRHVALVADEGTGLVDQHFADLVRMHEGIGVAIGHQHVDRVAIGLLRLAPEADIVVLHLAQQAEAEIAVGRAWWADNVHAG
jgi:hypothetical protein